MYKSISVIKEKSTGEQRVILTPREVGQFIDNGFEVFVETEAGVKLGISDESYENAGAHIVDSETAWNSSKLILKYKPPIDDEFQYLNEDKVVGAVYHAEGNKALVQKLLDSKVASYSYEFFCTSDDILDTDGDGTINYRYQFKMVNNSDGTSDTVYDHNDWKGVMLGMGDFAKSEFEWFNTGTQARGSINQANKLSRQEMISAIND